MYLWKTNAAYKILPNSFNLSAPAVAFRLYLSLKKPLLSLSSQAAIPASGICLCVKNLRSFHRFTENKQPLQTLGGLMSCRSVSAAPSLFKGTETGRFHANPTHWVAAGPRGRGCYGARAPPASSTHAGALISAQPLPSTARLLPGRTIRRI